MSKYPLEKPSVLIIEDEHSQQRLLTEKLTRLGYKVIVADNGKKGLDLWSENPQEIRIVLTDLVMPLTDGFEVIETIRQQKAPYTYIMVQTVLKDKNSLLRALVLGADDFIVKPVINEELVLRLRGALHRLRLQDHQLLIRGLAGLAATRSREDEGHLQRTKAYCHILARDLLHDDDFPLLTEQFAEDVANLSVLHDIGNNRIPDNLLNKRGQLTEKEYEMVKQHTVLGGEILMDLYHQTGSSFFLLAHDIVHYHHESWDGSGYPRGLQGEEIPLAARITTFADVYDSLLSKKIYKDPMPLNFVEKYIQEQKGKKFDPNIVDSYERNRDAFLNVEFSIPK